MANPAATLGVPPALNKAPFATSRGHFATGAVPPLVRITYSVERRIPASLLLIAGETEMANMVYGTLERALGSRVCVWHEPAIPSALKVLAVCRFRLILLDLALGKAAPGALVRGIKRQAPDTPLALLLPRPTTALAIERGSLGEAEARLAGAVAVLPRGDPEPLVRVVRQVLAMPAQGTGPPEDAAPNPHGSP